LKPLNPLPESVRLSPSGKRRRLFSAWIRKHPMWCAWQVTYRCNFKCKMCSYWRKTPESMVEPSLEDFRLGSRKLSQLGSLFISLAGGEPMIRTDILDIVEIIGRHHFAFITTNGYNVTADIARELYARGLWGASVSIDYADANKHDTNRGMTGAFNHAISALEYLSRARTQPHQRVNLMVTLMHDNLCEVEPLLKIARSAGANLMVQPYSIMKTGSRKFLPPPGSGRKLAELHGRYPNFLSNRVFLEKIDRFIEGGVPDCKAGRWFFNIGAFMEIAYCVENRANPVANLRVDSPEIIVKRLREASRSISCKCCWYNCRGEIEQLANPRGLMHALPVYLTDSFRNNGA